MGLHATFDPVAKLITLTTAPVSSFVNVNVAADLYSDAKKDWLADLNLNKYKFPFTAIGGQDLGNSVFAGSYYFLDNASGWRIKPYEADHFLELEGNLFGTDPAQGLFIPTVGGFNVVARLNTSSLTQRTLVGGGGGLTPEQENTLNLLKYQEQKVFVNTEQVTNGDGSARNPFNNWTSAVDFAETAGILEMDVMADATVDRQLKNFVINGVGNPTIDLNSQNMDNTLVQRCAITGGHTGTLNGTECSLVNVSNLSGVFLTVAAAGTIEVAPNSSLLISRISSLVPGQTWTLSMNSGQPSQATVQNVTGRMTVTNLDHAGDLLELSFAQGELTIDSSCVAGSLKVIGDCKVIDNSQGTTVDIQSTTKEIIYDGVL